MNFNVILINWQTLLQGLLVTLELSVGAIICSTLFGLTVAIIRSLNWRNVNYLLKAFVGIFRGSPLLIQLLFIFFGSSYIGFGLSPFPAAIVALMLYEGSFISEIFRAGIESVPRNQTEACIVLGLSRFRTMCNVVLPQAMRVSLAPLIGQYISLIKDTPLVIVISLAELMRYGQAISDRTGDAFAVFLVVAGIYFVICFPLSRFVIFLEGRKA